MDITLPGLNGLEATSRIAKEFPLPMPLRPKAGL